MHAVEPSTPKPFRPEICAHCGGILSGEAQAGMPPNGSASPTAKTHCMHCGNALPPDLPDPTTGIVPLAFLANLLDTETAKTTPLSLVVVASGREVRLPEISAIYLGRRDAGRNIYPHVDFTREKGAEMGVSRRHARIHQTDSGPFIEDLGSTNGTVVNQHTLVPFTLFPIEHGDVLELGQLKLVVSLPRHNHSPQV